MKIIKNSITSLMERGYLTLQVPDLAIGSAPEMEDVPDSWFFRQNSNRICFGKESGSLHLTVEGFRANREKVLAAYSTAPRRNHLPMPDDADPAKRRVFFENYAMNYLEKVLLNTQKYVNKLRAKADEAEKELKKYKI